VRIKVQKLLKTLKTEKKQMKLATRSHLRYLPSHQYQKVPMGRDLHLIRNVDHLHTCHHLQNCLHSSILLQTGRQYLEDQALSPRSSKYQMKMKYGSKEEDSSQNFLQQWNELGNGVKRKSEEWKNKGRQHVQRN